MSKRVLVTGGSGLIGGRVAESLASSGFQVRLGTRQSSANLNVPLGVEVFVMKWESEEQLCHACQDVDIIVNAMGMNAGDCAADPVAALKVNGGYTALLLGAAATTGVKRFVHISTAHVYGSPLAGTISESTHPSNIHPYATSHRCGEDAVVWADRQSDIEGIVLRLSNAYGRPLNPFARCWMLLVNDLCRQAVEKRRLTLQSDGLQYRDFIPLRNVCQLIVQLCEIDDLSSAKYDANAASIFNVGCGESITVAAMAQLIQLRTEVTLGYQVDLVRPCSKINNINHKLHYLSKNLALTWEACDRSSITEIDELLLFCRDNFTRQ